MKIFLVFYAIMNVVTLVLYGADKAKAKRGSWRIPEKTLLLFAMCFFASLLLFFPRLAVHSIFCTFMFRFLFGNENHKDWTLSLFNAVCQKDYKDPEMIEFRFTDDILFIKIREDVVFLYGSTLSFFEHQSTWSPNLPYRMLEYAAKHGQQKS